MLTRAGTIALRALVELARLPGQTLSVRELAARQGLPAPMLEQVVQRLQQVDPVAQALHPSHFSTLQADQSN